MTKPEPKFVLFQLDMKLDSIREKNYKSYLDGNGITYKWIKFNHDPNFQLFMWLPIRINSHTDMGKERIKSLSY